MDPKGVNKVIGASEATRPFPQCLLRVQSFRSRRGLRTDLGSQPGLQNVSFPCLVPRSSLDKMQLVGKEPLI